MESATDRVKPGYRGLCVALVAKHDLLFARFRCIMNHINTRGPENEVRPGSRLDARAAARGQATAMIDSSTATPQEKQRWMTQSTS